MWRHLPATAFKNGWDQVDCQNEIVALTCFYTPCSNAKASSHLWVWAKGNGLAYWGPSAETMDLSLDTDVYVS